MASNHSASALPLRQGGIHPLNALFFEGTSIHAPPLAGRCFPPLPPDFYLVLEVTSNGHVVDEVELISHESRHGVWDADDNLLLQDPSANYRVSVWIEDEKERYLRDLFGFIELNGSELYDRRGETYEIPLLCPRYSGSLYLKTRLLGFDEFRKLRLAKIQQSILSGNQHTHLKVEGEASNALNSYREHGQLENLEKAIVLWRIASRMVGVDHQELAGIWRNLGICYYCRFQHLRDIEDLNKSISRTEDAISLTPEGHPEKPACLNILGIALRERFICLGNTADIEDAVTSQQAAVNLTPDGHPDKAVHLCCLGVSLGDRFSRIGNAVDIEKAITSIQAALKLIPDGNPEKPSCFRHLAVCLKARFERFGNVTDIENAVTFHQAAVKLIPDSDCDKSLHLIHLALSLQVRYNRVGNLADMDNAIALNQEAINLIPDDHPDKPQCLNGLGISLEIRFRQLENIVDIDKSIASNQLAVNLTPDDDPQKPARLGSLGSSLEDRFRLLGNIVDIENAIKSNQEAVNLVPDGHPDKALYLMNLAGSFQARFDRVGNLADIDSAITSNQAALDLIPDGDPSKASCLGDLGQSLGRRCKRLGDLVDLENAIKAHQAAVNLTPDDHREKIIALQDLAEMLILRFFLFRHHQDAEAAISSLSASATSRVSSPVLRFNAAHLWHGFAATISHPSLLNAYECAITIIPLVAWLGLPITDRHQHLVTRGGITRDAVSVAISHEEYNKALEWFEQGRTIVWTQVLQLRTPVDNLRDIKPELAKRLIQVSQLLDEGTGQEEFSSGAQPSEEEEERLYRALVMERESIIDEVRSLSTFEDFLRPLRSFQLMKAAQEGPIIVLNATKKQCDALALVPGSDDIIHIPLPNITFDKVTELANELKDLLHSSGIRMRGERAAQRIEDEIEEESCKHILAELWKDLVKPVLDSLAFSPNPDTLPRIWWCTTGPLAFLPIHAAGIYDSDSTSEQMCNYAISSYIPSLSTLLGPPQSSMNSPFKLLSVIQPSAPGVSAIPNTREELKCIRGKFSDQTLVVLEEAEGTKGRVIKEMKECSWLHLACHGVQKPGEPTKSALILQDGHLTLEEIIRLNLPNAEFAFLSACQTTTGDESLSEEAVHIAGGMLLAGYHGVVATMWSIQDDLAPEVADEFYAHLTRNDQRPDSRRAAEALHVSIQKLRKKGDVPLTAWIPFVHLGA